MCLMYADNNSIKDILPFENLVCYQNVRCINARIEEAVKSNSC